MCMGKRLSDRALARYKAKGKKTGYIRVWKTVEKTWKKFRPGYYPNGLLYKKGLNRARSFAGEEQQLIHAFRDRKSAEVFAFSHEVIISTMVHPDWVKAIGTTDDRKHALTTKAIVMPAYPKKRVTVAEFKAAIKGKKIQKYSWE